MYKRTYEEDFKWSSEKIQPIAERLIYKKVWPDCKIISLDKHQNKLKLTLDIGGVDKLIQHSDGRVSFMAQRFRRWEQRRYDDFTIRALRPSGRLTELDKIVKAIEEGSLLAAFYAYGHVNQKEDGFLRFRIIYLAKFAQMHYEGKIPPGDFEWNTDDSSGFFCWSMNLLKASNLIFKEYLEPSESSDDTLSVSEAIKDFLKRHSQDK